MENPQTKARKKEKEKRKQPNPNDGRNSSSPPSSSRSRSRSRSRSHHHRPSLTSNLLLLYFFFFFSATSFLSLSLPRNLSLPPSPPLSRCWLATCRGPAESLTVVSPSPPRPAHCWALPGIPSSRNWHEHKWKGSAFIPTLAKEKCYANDD
ncbi:hypothetical protein CRG98_042650 [Punica granatum]|uniref:Uncharacterized protein n=1 Tax=Punica granatum TaxID=22663 RepID=A0A2I0HZ16_PUNGR|nr:hypothetical protein CRG98_042650 [Punica granatum]